MDYFFFDFLDYLIKFLVTCKKLKIMEKVCSKCKVRKDVKDFPNHKRTNDGLCSWCRQCHTEARVASIKKLPEGVHVARVKASRANHPLTARLTDWKRQGIPIDKEMYLKIHEDQQGNCKICGVHENDSDRKLSVDHCHDTNKIRGLLCKTCNLLLGYAKNDLTILQNAVKYLEENA